MHSETVMEPLMKTVHTTPIQLMRTRARTFYLASYFLPRSYRGHVQTLYAYCRVIDDLADEPTPGATRDDTLELLAHLEDMLHGRREVREMLIAQVLHVAERYGIPVEYLCMLIEGARFDMDMRTLDTLDDLVDYSTLVAGSVGMSLVYVLGEAGPDALAAACDLGVAMQITNVLRDVQEDLLRGRVYLPQHSLAAAGAQDALPARGPASPAIKRVMADLMVDARVRYAHGLQGLAYLDRSAQFAIYVAATLYARILDKIEERDFDVFTSRASVGPLEKWMVTLPAYAIHTQARLRRQ